MSEGIFVDGARHIFAGEAAEFLGVTRGHVARLCRKGKMQARKTKKGWEISGESVQEFACTRQQKQETDLSPIQHSPFPAVCAQAAAVASPTIAQAAAAASPTIAQTAKTPAPAKATVTPVAPSTGIDEATPPPRLPPPP